MSYLLRKITVIDENSKHHNALVDVLVEKGKISAIGNIEKNEKYTELEFADCYISGGFCDLYANFSDPGFEHRETLESGAAAAAAGGYTLICTIADTLPIIQSKPNVEYIAKSKNEYGVDIYPIGAITENLEGKNPTEMYDMHQAGAVGFSDAPHPINNSGVILRALQYVKPFDGIIFSMPYDATIVGDGQVNEGIYSVQTGMKGIPSIAEEIQIQRDLEILSYTKGRLHFYGISTKKGVDLIRKAKKEGLLVTASAFPHHLALEHNCILEFDTNYKTMPPLRSEADRLALIKGVLDGTIDAIVSQHTPLEIEAKALEFEYAGFGIIGLETAFAITNTILEKKIDTLGLVNLFSTHPRAIIDKKLQTIEEGNIANFTIFSTTEKWIFEEKNIKSKSRNTPFVGTALTGKIKGTFNNGKLNLQ